MIKASIVQLLKSEEFIIWTSRKEVKRKIEREEKSIIWHLGSAVNKLQKRNGKIKPSLSKSSLQLYPSKKKPEWKSSNLLVQFLHKHLLVGLNKNWP